MLCTVISILFISPRPLATASRGPKPFCRPPRRWASPRQRLCLSEIRLPSTWSAQRGLAWMWPGSIAAIPLVLRTEPYYKAFREKHLRWGVPHPPLVADHFVWVKADIRSRHAHLLLE